MADPIKDDLLADPGVKIDGFGFPEHPDFASLPASANESEIRFVTGDKHYGFVGGGWASVGSGAAPVSKPYWFDYLIDSATAVNADIQTAFDGGQLIVGDLIETREYHQGLKRGGTIYAVVAAGTGTADGGSYIDFVGFQLQAQFLGDLVFASQFGAKGDNVSDDTTALQSAMDFLSALGQGNFGQDTGDADYNPTRPTRLYLETGVYRTSASVGVIAAIDGSPRFTIEGAPDIRSTQIMPFFGSNHPVMEFSTTTGNLRAFTVRNLMLRGGTIGLKLVNVKYANFQNLNFFVNDDLGLEVTTGGFNKFVNCNWTETANDSMYLDGGNGDEFIGGLYGELAGKIHINGCKAVFTGGNFFGAYDRVDVNGYNGMGPAIFTVTGGGSLHVNGANILTVFNLVNCQNARAVAFDNCVMELDAYTRPGLVPITGHVFKVDLHSIRNGSTSLRGCEVTLRRNDTVFSLYELESAADRVVNSTIAGNNFTILTGAIMNIDDSLLDPQWGNEMYGNTFINTATV